VEDTQLEDNQLEDTLLEDTLLEEDNLLEDKQLEDNLDKQLEDNQVEGTQDGPAELHHKESYYNVLQPWQDRDDGLEGLLRDAHSPRLGQEVHHNGAEASTPA